MAQPLAARGQTTAQPDKADVWPHTTRFLPWMLAGFLTLLFLVPINSVELKLPSPVDPHLDRYVLGGIFAVWIVVAALGRSRGRQQRPALFLASVVMFVAVALLSVVVNIGDLTTHGLLELTQNRLALLFGFVFFAFFTVSAVRPAEVRNFSVLIIALASVTAIGVIYERRTGFNVFYDFFGHLFDPIATVAESPTEINPDPERESRKTIVGPTDHGLAVTTMMVLAIPFAIVAFMQVRERTRWLYALAIALIMGAALSTERKTGVLAPIAAVAVIAAYRPRAVLRMVPLGILMAGFIYVASPGALSTIYELEETFNSDSSAGRSDDYAAIAPEVLAHPLLGSGYGSRDIAQVDSVRILDNEYLGELLSVGLVGVLAFMAMILSSMVVAHPVIRSGDPTRAGPALAASASCAVFGVACLLFDSMSFPQAPYMFFFAAAVATVAAAREVPERARERRRQAAPGASLAGVETG
jgi:hypothetical protein